MKYSRISLWILILLGTLLLFESIKYKKSHRRDLRFYSTLIYSIIAYLLAAYLLFSSLA